MSLNDKDTHDLTHIHELDFLRRVELHAKIETQLMDEARKTLSEEEIQALLKSKQDLEDSLQPPPQVDKALLEKNKGYLLPPDKIARIIQYFDKNPNATKLRRTAVRLSGKEMAEMPPDAQVKALETLRAKRKKELTKDELDLDLEYSVIKDDNGGLHILYEGNEKMFGKGGQGLVKVSQNIHSKEFEAVKILKMKHMDVSKIQRASQEAEAYKEFELSSGAQKRTAGALTPKDMDTDAYTTVYIFQPWGTNLFHYIKQGLLDEMEKFDIANKLLDNLEFIHNLGYIHRDIKPENVLYNKKTGEVFFIDFGLIQKKSEPDSLVAGTENFRAPEAQFLRYSDKSDIFSLGATFKELFAANAPNSADKNPFMLLISNALKIALCEHKPEDRPNIDQVRKMMKELRELIQLNQEREKLLKPPFDFKKIDAFLKAEGFLKIIQHIPETMDLMLANALYYKHEELFNLYKNNVLHHWNTSSGNNALMRMLTSNMFPILTDFLLKNLAILGFNAKEIINQRNNKGDTALHLAVKQGNLNAVKALIAEGADFNIKNNAMDTPLMLADKFGHYEIYNYIVSMGGKIDPDSAQAKHSLFLAIQSKNSAGVQSLVMSGVDPNQWLENDDTPISYAVKKSMKLVQELMALGAQPTKRNKDGTNALDRAMEGYNVVKNNIETTEILLGDEGLRKSLNEEDPRGGTILQRAIELGDLQEVCSLLVQKGADPNHKTKNGESPLSRAIKYSNKENVKFLLQCGADPALGFEALNTLDAKQFGKFFNKEEIEAMLRMDKKQLIDSPVPGDVKGASDLQKNIEKGYLHTVELFLKNGGNPNFKDKNGDTALHYALRLRGDQAKFKLKIIETLMQHHANPNELNNKGKSALAMATELGDPAIVELLKKAPEKPPAPMVHQYNLENKLVGERVGHFDKLRGNAAGLANLEGEKVEDQNLEGEKAKKPGPKTKPN